MHADEGVEFIDYMEHHYISTQGLIFVLLHWMTHLKGEVAKTSARIKLDFFLEATLGAGSFSMVLDRDTRAGTLPTSGIVVQHKSGFILNTSDLEARFPLIKLALGNTERSKLVEECPIPGCLSIQCCVCS